MHQYHQSGAAFTAGTDEDSGLKNPSGKNSESEIHPGPRKLRSPGDRKTRLDRLIVERGLEQTRQKAQALIMAGRVLVNGVKVEKAGTLVEPESAIEMLGAPSKYVGRGGLKLEAALQEFAVDARERVFLDVGSSTGGFVDCLLQHGAARVIAVDAGTNQMDWRLRQDPRVRLLERTNARYLEWGQIGEKVDGITMDLSFISATLVLPRITQFCNPGTRLLVLVKPQFEVGKGHVGRGGIVRDERLRLESVEKVLACARQLGFENFQTMLCPVAGAEGNREYFLGAEFAG